jgi:hypothetical protein
MNQVFRPFFVTLALALAGLAPACALKPPVENSGALAKDGVQVSVVGQRCTETVEPEWPGANLVETVVELAAMGARSRAVDGARPIRSPSTPGRARRSRCSS